MTQYQQKNGDIVIYKVKEKINEKGPDWTGKALIDGVEKQVSIWIKSDTMLAGQIKDKWNGKKEDQKSSPKDEDMDSEIPF